MFSSRYKKRERTQNWSFEEKKFLLDLCRKNMQIIENKRLDSGLTSLKNRAWKIIHQQFAATFGTDRNCNRLKEQWRRMKACTRAEILDYQHRVTKHGQALADKKKPNLFTFEIWNFMQDAKKACRNEVIDDIDYSKIELGLEKNYHLNDILHGQETDESNVWERTDQMCEVHIDEESEENTEHNSPGKNFRAGNSFDDIPMYLPKPTQHELPPINSFDILSFLRNHCFIENTKNSFQFQQNCDKSLKTNTEINQNEELRKNEQEVRLQILKIELETAKIKRETAEIKKEIALRKLKETE